MKNLLVFSFLIGTIGFGQTRDAELWAELGLKTKVGDKWSLKYESQARFNKNATTLKTYYNEFFCRL